MVLARYFEFLVLVLFIFVMQVCPNVEVCTQWRATVRWFMESKLDALNHIPHLYPEALMSALFHSEMLVFELLIVQIEHIFSKKVPTHCWSCQFNKKPDCLQKLLWRPHLDPGPYLGHSWCNVSLLCRKVYILRDRWKPFMQRSRFGLRADLFGNDFY